MHMQLASHHIVPLEPLFVAPQAKPLASPPHPSSCFGVPLILGGLLGFLPILGLLMLPLGVLPLAEDLPFLRCPTM
jgi:hypothetical protein